jgi:hypothetical protein
MPKRGWHALQQEQIAKGIVGTPTPRPTNARTRLLGAGGAPHLDTHQDAPDEAEQPPTPAPLPMEPTAGDTRPWYTDAEGVWRHSGCGGPRQANRQLRRYYCGACGRERAVNPQSGRWEWV